jgi:hypothetical protein
MFFTRALDRKQYGEMLCAIQTKLNDDFDPKERRYLLVPEKISEGGILLKDYPGRDPENEKAYKSMRHWLQKSTGVNLSPYPWPLVGISAEEVGRIGEESRYPWKGLGVSEEEALEDWITNGGGIALIPEDTLGQTHLKARGDAPGWTLNELRVMANVMESGYGIKCTHFPKAFHLTMDYGSS